MLKHFNVENVFGNPGKSSRSHFSIFRKNFHGLFFSKIYNLTPMKEVIPFNLSNKHFVFCSFFRWAPHIYLLHNLLYKRQTLNFGKKIAIKKCVCSSLKIGGKVRFDLTLKWCVTYIIFDKKQKTWKWKSTKNVNNVKIDCKRFPITSSTADIRKTAKFP